MDSVIPKDAVMPAMPGADEKLSLKGPIVAGLLIAGLFLGSFGVWAVFAPLKSAAVAPGVVTVDTKRKTIQHLEGGIVDEIRVREGQEVRKGDVLFVLNQTRSEAELSVIMDKLHADLALKARLEAERDKADKIVFPDDLRLMEDDPDVAALMKGQVSIFEARRKSIRGQKAILRQKIAQFRSEIEGLEAQVAEQNDQIALLEDEESGLRDLFKRGMVGKQRLRELQRQIAEVRGLRSRNQAAIATNQQSIAEARLQIVDIETKQLNEVVQELRDVESEILDLRERKRALSDVLKRTEIKSPISGVAVDLRVSTPGGVVGPGEPLVDIVPKNERLIVEARVDPIDIDVVEPEMEAMVRLMSFSQRNTKPVPGTVLTISADRLVDERTGVPYYLARIALDPEAEELSGMRITPGMPAEVMIVTGEQTPLDYLLKPLEQTIERAMREK